MHVEFVPLLQIQRDLYAMPRGMERFRAYIRTMTDPETGDLALPLVPMNPMGKDHVPTLIDEYIGLDAEGVAGRAVEHAAVAHGDVQASFKTGLVVADDLKGGWTNRYASEFTYRLETRAMHRRGWLLAVLWTSEPADARTVATVAAMAVHRGAYIERHGSARTLGRMMAQEGWVAAMAGCEDPALEPDDLIYSQQVLVPLLEASDRPTVIAGLFGDAAARDLGYPPQGLTARAGFAVGLHEAIPKVRGER
jgi:hypothetical protein